MPFFFPMFGEDEADDAFQVGSLEDNAVPRESPSGCIEESVLDDIREMILQAQRHGCWKAGVGGIGQVCYVSHRLTLAVPE